MKTCLVHDWLNVFAGAESVLEEIYRIFPSNIYTLFYNEESFKNALFSNEKVITSFLQKCPGVFSKHTLYSPFFSKAIEQFDLSEYDLILSSSHCVAKGVIPSPNQTHICYCHSPMRYIWDLSHLYLEDYSGIKKWILQQLFYKWRQWDVASSNRVDHFIANSEFVKRRIEKVYRRKATVIYPPVNIDRFKLCLKKDEYYITASRLVSYKGVKQVVEAFSKLDRKLLVIGDGPNMKIIKKIATSNIEILGHVSNEKLVGFLQQAKAFIFNSIEDFGITPVEAQACGTPVIALGKGGALETILDGKTGLFYEKSSPDAIRKAVLQFENMEFDRQEIRMQAEKFSSKRFSREFESFVKGVIP